VNFSGHRIIHAPNRRNGTAQRLIELETFCHRRISQAWVILGRIREFGAYNATEDETAAIASYARALILNDHNPIRRMP
jgi:hypothetical protein